MISKLSAHVGLLKMYIETSIEKRMKSIFLSGALFGSAIHFVGVDNTCNFKLSETYLCRIYRENC